jgi:mannose-6-phosphate isomerase-like protein (cupin superfamily)
MIQEGFTEWINYGDRMLCFILRSTFYRQSGIEFFTKDDATQQVGYMRHAKGHIIQAHKHLEYQRNISDTNEVLLIKEGEVKVNLYTSDEKFVCERILKKGDLILLISGGHSFEFLETSEVIEIKQGPYAGNKDKIRF